MHRIYKFLIVLLCMLATTHATGKFASSQVPLPYAQSWQVQSFYKDADLADKYVSMIDFTADGSVWLAVTDGLYFFDGYTWTKYTTEHGLPSNYVRSVLVTTDGTLWVGTDNGAGIFRNGAFDGSGARNNLAGPSVRRIVEGADGSIWFCCDQFPNSDISGGLTRLYQGQFKTWHSQDGLESDYVSDYFRDSQGRQFILTNRGLLQFVDDELRHPLKDAEIWSGDTYVWSIVESASHGVIVATDSNFYKLKENQWRRIPNANPNILQPKLGVTSEGEIYTLTSDPTPKIMQWNGDGFVAASEPLKDVIGDLQVVRESPDGALWFVGFERLVRWEREKPSWHIFPNLNSPVFKDKNGGVWFSSNDKAALRLHYGLWTKLEDVEPPFIEDSSGNVWMVSGGQLAVWKSNEEIEQLIVPGMQKTKPILVDAEGALWTYGLDTANQIAVARYLNGDWNIQVLDQVTADVSLNHFSLDPEKGIWLVLSQGGLPPYNVLHVTDLGIQRLPLPPQVTKSNPPRILAGDNGKLLLGGFFGFFESNDKGIHWIKVETTSSAIDQFVRRGEDLWITGMGHVGGQPGLMRLSARREPQYFPDVRGRIVGFDDLQNSLYIASYGMIHEIDSKAYELKNRLTTPFFPRVTNIVKGSSNELWCGADGQTYRYAPHDDAPETKIGPASDQLVDGDNLVVNIQAVDRFIPKNTPREYQYSIKIDNQEFSSFRPLSMDVPIANLGLGEHQIQVRVRNEAGHIDKTPATLSVQVVPIPLQSKLWFLPLVATIFLLFVGLSIFAIISWRHTQRLATGLQFEVAKQTERLSSSERKYRLLFEDSQDAIALFGSDGVLQKYNPAARELLSISPDQNVSITNLFPSPVEEKRFQEELTSRGSLRGLRFRVRGANDKFFESLLSVNSWMEDDQKYVGHQMIIRDISDLVQLQKQLSETKKMEAIGRLAGGIAHDFNNFLAVMMYGADLIKLTSQDNPAINQGVQMILDAADRAKTLTSKIQTFSRAPSINTGVIDPQIVLKAMRNLLLGVVPANVQLHLEIDPDLGHIYADPQQFEQVIMNLVVNACHAMPNGGSLRIEATNVFGDTGLDSSTKELSQSSSFVRICVVDSGTGMAPEILDKIFDPFFTTKPQGQGTGLGLAIVYGIVQQFGGRVDVHSQLGEGTVFQIDFPALDKPEPDNRIDLPNPPSCAGSESILLVEDEKSLRELTRQSLESLGYRVLQADNGQSAINILENESSVDLVISDVVMPNSSGFELHSWLKQHHPKIKVLLVSGYPQTSEGGRNDPFDVPFLQKPFRPTELASRVRSIFDSDSFSNPNPAHKSVTMTANVSKNVSLR